MRCCSAPASKNTSLSALVDGVIQCCYKFCCNNLGAVVQGAAFDLPEASAELMLAQAEELTKRKFTIERPSSLPLMEERG